MSCYDLTASCYCLHGLVLLPDSFNCYSIICQENRYVTNHLCFCKMYPIRKELKLATLILLVKMCES